MKFLCSSQIPKVIPNGLHWNIQVNGGTKGHPSARILRGKLGQICFENYPRIPALISRKFSSRAHSNWSWRRDLNPRPSDYKSDALPAELRQPPQTDNSKASEPKLQVVYKIFLFLSTARAKRANSRAPPDSPRSSSVNGYCGCVLYPCPGGPEPDQISVERARARGQDGHLQFAC